jgi:hypothetical protein
MECNLQTGNKQRKEEPNDDNFEKTGRITYVQPHRNGEGYVRLPNSQKMTELTTQTIIRASEPNQKNQFKQQTTEIIPQQK